VNTGLVVTSATETLLPSVKVPAAFVPVWSRTAPPMQPAETPVQNS